MDRTQETIRRIGLSLIDERREVVMAEAVQAQAQKATSGAYAEKSLLGRDLLSVLSARAYLCIL